jgi:hypothetical protein
MQPTVGKPASPLRMSSIGVVAGLVFIALFVGWPRQHDGVQAAAGDAPAGAVTLTPPSGDSATNFVVGFSSTQSCPGNGDAGYRVHTFITPAGSDVGAFAWNGFGEPTNGPSPTLNLYRDNGNPLSNLLPDVQAVIVSIPPAQLAGGIGEFALFPPGSYPAGDYLIGVACVNNNSTERFWATAITITDDASGGPSEVAYEVAAPESTTTTTTTTTTTSTSTSTTTTISSTTTTTNAATTTTTAAGGGTTSTTIAGSSSTTSTPAGGAGSTSTSMPAVAVPVGGGSPTGGGAGSSGTPQPQPQIAATGSSSWRIAIWAMLLLVFGRMALLIGRKPKVIDERR